MGKPQAVLVIASVAVIVFLGGCHSESPRSESGHAKGVTEVHGISRSSSGKDFGCRWALLVGIDDYARARDLHFCVRDVQSLHSQLLSLGFSRDRMKVLRDGLNMERLPVHGNIEAELDALLGKLNTSKTTLEIPGIAEKGDMVLIALSGHGIYLNGKSYFCPADAQFDKPDQTLIPIQDIYKRLEHCPACFKLVFIDACRNDPRPENTKGIDASSEMHKFAGSLNVPDEAGTFVLTSCAPGQISLEEPKFKHGVFMNYLLAGLAGAADCEGGNNNGKISVFELFAYVNAKTKDWVFQNKSGVAQTPTLFSPKEITQQFEFVRVASARPQTTIVTEVLDSDKKSSTDMPEYLADCKLVFSVDTGATVKIEQVAQYVGYEMGDLVQSAPLQIDYKKPEAMKPTCKGDCVYWEWPVEMGASPNSLDATLWPQGMSLSIRVAVSRDGQFWLGTLGPNDQDHLMVLAQLGGLQNYLEFSGNYLPSSSYGQPHDSAIDTNDKQTILSSFFATIYSEFATQDLLTGDPVNTSELYNCPMRLRNFFNRPITVVNALLFHEQFDYDWFQENHRPPREKANLLWSPIAREPDQDANLLSGFTMRVTGDTRSAVLFRASSDNQNKSSVRLCGLKPDSRSKYHYTKGTRASIEVDNEANEWLAFNHDCSSAIVALYDEIPVRVELRAVTHWSSVLPQFRYATFGNVRIRECFISPEGSSKGQIRPQVWILRPE